MHLDVLGLVSNEHRHLLILDLLGQLWQIRFVVGVLHRDRPVNGDSNVVLLKDGVTQHSCVQVNVVDVRHLNYSCLR